MGGRRANIISFRVHNIIDIDFMAQVARRRSCERVEAITISDLARENFEELVKEMKLKYPEDAKNIYDAAGEQTPENNMDPGHIDI